ncbi:hypothetical protein [Microcystis phage Mwe-JY08]
MHNFERHNPVRVFIARRLLDIAAAALWLSNTLRDAAAWVMTAFRRS